MDDDWETEPRLEAAKVRLPQCSLAKKSVLARLPDRRENQLAAASIGWLLWNRVQAIRAAWIIDPADF
jgi:hypothetical protein